MTLGKILHEARINLGEGLTSAGKKAGISPNYLWEIEKGQKNNPNDKMLMELSRLYSLDFTKLKKLTGIKHEDYFEKLPPAITIGDLEFVLRVKKVCNDLYSACYEGGKSKLFVGGNNVFCGDTCNEALKKLYEELKQQGFIGE
jgi:transcriptional regulator with XRE-family HTH domain